MQAKSLQRAANKLTQTLRNQCEIHGKKPRHYNLAWFTFSPLLSSKLLKFRLFITSKSFDCKYLFVVFDAFGKKVAFTPNVAGNWFGIGRGEDLQTRAVEVLTEHFRRLERTEGKNSQNPEAFNFLLNFHAHSL